MAIDDLRPIVCGMAGAVIAIWLSNALSRWVPDVLNGKPKQKLLEEQRLAIRIANTMSAFGTFGMLALYQWGGSAKNDWRPCGLGIGFTLASPPLSLPAVALFARRSVQECLVSYAIYQRLPIPLTALSSPRRPGSYASETICAGGCRSGPLRASRGGHDPATAPAAAPPASSDSKSIRYQPSTVSSGRSGTVTARDSTFTSAACLKKATAGLK